jgi:hypothetical protein
MDEVVCALCDHPHDEHVTASGRTGCRHVLYGDSFTLCDCPGWEPPADETDGRD